MSIASTRWAREVRGVSLTEKAVLYTLADYVRNGDVFCFPSQERIAADTSIRRQTVVKTLKSLEEKGFLISNRKRKKGMKEYYLNIPQEYQDKYKKKEADNER